jgi:hypothetical protein
MKVKSAIKQIALIILLTSASTSFAIEDVEGVWDPKEMTESYMSQLTKWQCVEKTKQTMTAGCSKSVNCTKSMSGLLGDCVTYAKGSHKEFCSRYRDWRILTCMSNEIDARTCALFELGQSPLCDSGKIKER